MATDSLDVPETPGRAPGENGTSRNPVFFRVPMGWKELSEKEKDRFLDEAASAIVKHSQPEKRVAPRTVRGSMAPQQPEQDSPS